LIDSGAIGAAVPASIPERESASNRSPSRNASSPTASCAKKGIALFQYGARLGGADGILGEAEDSVLRGTLTREALGLPLDPLRRELKPYRRSWSCQPR